MKNLVLVFIILIRIIIYLVPFLYVFRLPYKLNLNGHKYKGIPKIIYRTFNRRYINGKMYNLCHKKWLELNPDYQVVWFSDKQCDKVVQNYSHNVWYYYKKLKPGAFKADLWRLCMLYKYGGVYVDAYTTPYKSIKYIIDSSNLKEKRKNKFISVLDCNQSGGGVHNGFIISTPYHPFLKQCISDIVSNIKSKNYTNHVLGVTGPVCLYNSIEKVIQRKNRKIKVGLNFIGELQFYLLYLEWGPFQYICDSKEIIMSKKYNTFHYFYTKNMYKSKGYTDMWKKRNIYYD